MLFHQVILFPILLLIVVFRSTKVDSYCLAEDTNPYSLFATKTAYDAVRGTAGSETTCKPVQIWILNRHGTRFASTSGLQKMKLLGIELQTKILNNYAQNLAPPNNKLCDKDLEALADWKWDGSIEDYGFYLTTEGWRELREIGQRYQNRYPDLMSNYSDGQMYFRHTVEQRTHASCLGFIEGLFGSYDGVPVDNPREDDQEIRPYKHCDAWLKNVDDNDDRKTEQKIFRNESDYRKLLDDMSERLGFQNTLETEDIEIMYDLCRYYVAWLPNITSPWCSIFRKYETFLLEYHEDLSVYYKSSYGHEYNTKLGCMALKGMMENFDRTVQTNETKTKGIFLFSHDTMMNMLLAVLGYSKDDQALSGSDYQDLLVSRMFRSSLNTPFAANVAAVLHKCEQSDYQVQLFLNERPMKIDGCPQGLCSWDYFKNKFAFTKSCNLDFCNSSNV